MKDLLITSISAYSNLLNNFIFADFLLVKDYQQVALTKPVIAPFKKWFKTISLRKFVNFTFENSVNW